MYLADIERKQDKQNHSHIHGQKSDANSKTRIDQHEELEYDDKDNTNNRNSSFSSCSNNMRRGGGSG